MDTKPWFLINLIAGGIAGTAVDLALFPLDTIKTRLQSAQGFLNSGGFRGIYSGFLAAAGGSAPTAALFFVTYELSKVQLNKVIPQDSPYIHMAHMISACMGEISACLVRVPTDNVKQKMQAKLFDTTTSTIRSIVTNKGIKGFYVGYGTTLIREIPFSVVQFPLYEKFKKEWSNYQNRIISPWQASVCGSIAGGIAGTVTTPMDVLKTRLMLGHDAKGVPYMGTADVFRRILSEEGARAFMSGVGPRVMWITIGGSVFFGAYEKSKKILVSIL